MKRCAFIWNFDKAEQIYDYWRDGLRAAIEKIGETCDVDVFLGEKYKEAEDIYDAILIWGDSNELTIDHFINYKGQKGLILTTMPDNIDNLKKYDVIFCESKPVYAAVRVQGLHAVRAFGTDTEFFSPDETVEKDILFLFIGCFSPWKRQRDIACLGNDLWCVGNVQPDGQEDLQACLERGVHVAQGYYRVEYIRDLYRRAKRVIIPAIHGSERTVLEAMSMGVLPEFTENARKTNVKAYSYVEEYNATTKLTVREFILKYYNAKQYAEKIMKGLALI